MIKHLEVDRNPDKFLNEEISCRYNSPIAGRASTGRTNPVDLSVLLSLDGDVISVEDGIEAQLRRL